MAAILMVEDVEASTVGTVGTLRGWGNNVISATSIDEALARLDGVDCATIDQRLPQREGDDADASEEAITELARRVGERVPFIWVTAHDVSPERLEMPNCLGVVGKAGEVTAEVTRRLQGAVDRFVVRSQGQELDQVLLELRLAEDGRMLAMVMAWKPEEHPFRPDLLPDWLRVAVLQTPGRTVFVKARAWLGARRFGQLDLCEYELVARRNIDESEIWDD